MKKTLGLGVALVLGAGVATVAACSSDDPGSAPKPPGGDAGPTPEASAPSLAIAPGDSSVATCRSLTFKATPADGVAWSLAGEGKLDAGKYDAPIKVPSPAKATVTASRNGAPASAVVTLATAFPGSQLDVPRAKNATGPMSTGRLVVARGSRVYAVSSTNVKPYEVRVARSNDGGATWDPNTALVASHDGDALLTATSAAIDPANPDVVHVAVRADAGGAAISSIAEIGNAGAGSLLVLATSVDGGAKFTQRTLYSGGNGDVAAPDVAAPAPGAVVVSAPTSWIDTTSGDQGGSILVWSDSSGGAGFGALVALDTGYAPRWSVGKELRLPKDNYAEASGVRLGGGGGAVCLLAHRTVLTDATAGAEEVACSSDGGKTFGPFVAAITGGSSALDHGAIAVGKDPSLVAIVTHARDSAADALGKSKLVVTTDGGKTFGAPVVLADFVGSDAVRRSVEADDVLVDDEGVIWLVRTVDRTQVQIDKSCDKGKTLSGSILLDRPGSTAETHLFASSAGVFLSQHRAGSGGRGDLTSVQRVLAP